MSGGGSERAESGRPAEEGRGDEPGHDRPEDRGPFQEGDPRLAQPPSARKILLATGIALAVAVLLLVTVVLPAEYDLDPLGTGEALGLVVLGGGRGEIPVREDGLRPREATYRVDRRTFELPPEGEIEWKYRLEAGKTMLYSWEASNWVRSEMHSERDGAPEGTAQFFEVAEETLHRHGSYTAPFPGIHGWYWRNESPDTVTVTLRAAGFFTSGTVFQEGTPPFPEEITRTPEELWEGWEERRWETSAADVP